MDKKKEWYLKNRERILQNQKEFRENNQSVIKQRNAEYYEKNKEVLLNEQKEYQKKTKTERNVYKKIYVKKNESKVKTYQKEYRQNNKEKQNEYMKVYQKERMKTDPLFKLSKNIRTLVGNSFKNTSFKKNTKTEKILGCSFEDFKTYLESKFEPWMNWNNKGNWNGYPKETNTHWDVDHIVPLHTAKTVEDVIRLNHYTNLQPLCSYTNRVLKKSKN